MSEDKVGLKELADAIIAANSSQVVNNVTPKVPKFMAFDPELWVEQCKAAFAVSNVTSVPVKLN